MTSSNGNYFPRYWPFVRNSPVPSEFPAQRPVTRSFDVFFDLRLSKRLRKQSWCWWFETLSSPLWRHCNVNLGHVWIITSPKLSSKIEHVNERGPRSFAPTLMKTHYSEITWTSWLLQSPPTRLILQKLFRLTSKKTSKLSITGPFLGESTGNGGFPSQSASNVESVSTSWCHHE